MLHYILQIIAFQVVFLLIYDVFLKRETFFNYNRLYLVGTSVLSLLLPFIKLDTMQAVVPKDFVIVLPEVIIGNLNPPSDLDKQVALQTGIELHEPSLPIWQIIFYAGITIASLIFIVKLIKLLWLKHSNPRRWQGNILIVRLMKSSSAFSFFNTIFLGEKISEQEKPTILKHELVHVKQLHSLDLLIFEVMRILLWFNPLVYMYQNRVKALHEFIADEIAVKQNGKKDYYQQLLNQVFETQIFSFTNTFFNKSLIKKRIIMLQKSKSKQVSLFKYMVLVPIIFGMLIYTSAEVRAQEKNTSKDVSKFEYSMKFGEKMSPKVKEIHERYEEFLMSNSDYVSWGTVDFEQKRINYSVHHISETIPEGYQEGEVSFPNGKSYKTFMNYSYFSEELIQAMEEADSKRFDKKSEVPFAVIDNAPAHTDCKDLSTNEERKKCTSNKIAKFVNKNFNTDLATQLGLSGRQRISVGFKVDEKGYIKTIYARAPHPELEKETKRVIEMLPKFIPGTQKGKPVTVPYGLPIIFEVNNDTNTKSKESGLKDFKIIIENTNNGIKMKSSKGTAWINLDISLEDYKSQAIDEYGMSSVNNKIDKTGNGLADFLFTITKKDNMMVLKGIKGTAWTELKFSLAKNEKSIVNQYGVSKTY